METSSSRRHDKLVRDRIPEIIRARGATPITHVAGDVEYDERLRAKLREEVEEFLASETPQHAIEELADIQEVIRALCVLLGTTSESIEAIRQSKAEARGGFEERIVLEETRETPPSNP